MYRIFAIILAGVMLLTLLSGCTLRRGNNAGTDESPYMSFLNIPGVTHDEIAAIKALQVSREYFVFAGNYSTEMFIMNGEVRGFAALLCEWLAELFDIPFRLVINEWDELVEGLESFEIDFTGELTANEERRTKYIMTDDIAQRLIITLRMEDAEPLHEIAKTRPLRYAFLDGTTTSGIVAKHEDMEFEVFYVGDYSHAYELLSNGSIDMFFDESPAEAAFDYYGGVVAEIYYPIIFSPVSLATQNP